MGSVALAARKEWSYLQNMYLFIYIYLSGINTVKLPLASMIYTLSVVSSPGALNPLLWYASSKYGDHVYRKMCP